MVFGHTDSGSGYALRVWPLVVQSGVGQSQRRARAVDARIGGERSCARSIYVTRDIVLEGAAKHETYVPAGWIISWRMTTLNSDVTPYTKRGPQREQQ